MIKSPKISIIIPVYNAELFLDNCLSSVKNQTFKDFEVICINDCSNDGSLEILNNYAKKDDRFKVYNNSESLMAGGSRNKGLSLSKGEYIHFLDADDWIEEDLYELVYKKAKKDDLDLTIFDVVVYDNVLLNTYTISYVNLDPLKNYNWELLEKPFNSSDCLPVMFDLCLAPWNKLYKKEFLDNNSLSYPEGRWFEDMLFFFNVLFKAKNIGTVDKALLTYRVNLETSMIGSKDRKYFDFFDNYDDIENTIKEHGVFEKVKYNFYAFKYAGLDNWYKNIHDDLKSEFFNRIESDLNSSNFSNKEISIIINNMNYGTDTIKEYYNSRLSILLKISRFLLKKEKNLESVKIKVLGIQIYKKYKKNNKVKTLILGIKVRERCDG